MRQKMVSEALDELLKNQDSLFFVKESIPVTLYWVGRKNEAVFWLELYLLRKRQEIELGKLKDTMKIFDGLASYQTIHNYSKQNIVQYISIIKKVVNWDRTHTSYLKKYKDYNEFSERAEAIRKELIEEKYSLLQYKDFIENHEKSLNDVMQSQMSSDCEK